MTVLNPKPGFAWKQLPQNNYIDRLGVPVELDRAGDVTGLVQQHVLIGLGYHQVRLDRQALRDPTRR